MLAHRQHHQMSQFSLKIKAKVPHLQMSRLLHDWKHHRDEQPGTGTETDLHSRDQRRLPVLARLIRPLESQFTPRSTTNLPTSMMILTLYDIRKMLGKSLRRHLPGLLHKYPPRHSWTTIWSQTSF
jgi:hypothetical protein